VRERAADVQAFSFKAFSQFVGVGRRNLEVDARLVGKLRTEVKGEAGAG
jgi:hypothetical protein